MPVGFGVGDHQLKYIDFTTESMVGSQQQPIKHPKAQWLNRRIPQAKHAYVKRLECNIVKNRLQEKMIQAHQESMSPEVL